MIAVIMHYAWRILKFLWRITKFLIKLIVGILVYLSLPLVFFSGERKFLPFNDYRLKATKGFWLSIYHGVLYILWGSLTVFYGYYTYFTFRSLDTYGHDIFGYEQTSNYKLLIGGVSFFLGGLYFVLIFSLIRRTNSNRGFGQISIISNALRFCILFIWTFILVTPLYINEQIQKGKELNQVELFEEMDSKIVERLALIAELDNSYGIVERWQILEEFYKDIHLQQDFRMLVKKHMKIFLWAFIIKIILLYVDIRYINHKVNEMERVI